MFLKILISQESTNVFQWSYEIFKNTDFEEHLQTNVSDIRPSFSFS